MNFDSQETKIEKWKRRKQAKNERYKNAHKRNEKESQTKTTINTNSMNIEI